MSIATIKDNILRIELPLAYLNGALFSKVPLKFLVRPHEPEVTAFMVQSIKPGMKVADVGAAFGYHTVTLSRLVGTTGKVYAYEPDPRSFRLLSRTVRLNRLSNVVPRPVAVMGAKGTLKIKLSPKIGRSSFYTEGREWEVGTVSLNSEGNSLGFIKLDAEGAEQDILKNVPLKRGTKLTIEYAPKLLSDPYAFLDLLKSLGLRYWPLVSTIPMDDRELTGFARARGHINLGAEKI